MLSDKHLQHIDVLKGVVIFFVVVSHAFHFGFAYYSSPLRTALISLDMPVFMFLSGYLAALGRLDFTTEGYEEFWRKKARQLFLPLLTLPIGYAYFYGIPMQEMIFGVHHGGYWFTWVLFLMFVLWFVFRLADHYLNRERSALLEVLFALLTLFFVLIIDLPWKEGYAWSYEAMSWGKLNYLYHHFLIGYFVARYPSIERILVNPALTALFVLAFLALIYIECTHRAVLGGIPASLFGVWAAFGMVQQLGRGKDKLTRIFSYLGSESRTIYFTHYFFLFSIPWIGNFLKELRYTGLRVFGWEVIFSMSYAVVVISITLLAVRLIKSNPILAWMCYGKAMEEPSQMNNTDGNEQSENLSDSSIAS